MHMEEDLGFSPGLISRWSKTKTSQSFDKIVDIVRYLDVSFEDLLRMKSIVSGEKRKRKATAFGKVRIFLLIMFFIKSRMTAVKIPSTKNWQS